MRTGAKMKNVSQKKEVSNELKQVIKEIYDSLDTLVHNLKKTERNHKTCAQLARIQTLEINDLFKKFRKASITGMPTKFKRNNSKS